MVISDQTFYKYFICSLPSSFDLFISLYDDPSFDVDVLCDTRREGRGCASEYLGRVHIDIAGPIPVKSAGRKEYDYVVDGHSSCGIHAAAAAQVGGT